jgi:hypothetical protein
VLSLHVFELQAICAHCFCTWPVVASVRHVPCVFYGVVAFVCIALGARSYDPTAIAQSIAVMWPAYCCAVELACVWQLTAVHRYALQLCSS